MGRPPSQQTAALIDTLTSAERGYIRKALERPLGRRAGAMLELYDAYCVDTRDDARAVTDVLSKAGTGSSQLKRALFDAIVKHLRSIDDSDADRSSAMRLILEATMLLERGLYQSAYDRYQAALDHAREAHLFTAESEALSGLIRIVRAVPMPQPAMSVTACLEQRAVAMKRASRLADMSVMSDKIMQGVMRGWDAGDARDVCAEVVSSTLADDHPRLVFWHHHVQALAHHALGNEREQDAALEAMIEVIEKHPVFLREDASVTTLSNALVGQLHREDTQRARATLALLERLVPTSARVAEMIYFNATKCAMFIALIERDIDTLRGFEHQVNNGIEQYPMHGATVQQAWHQCMAIAALHYGDPSEGVRHIMHVLDVPTLSASQRMAPLLTELLLFSAIGEHDLVRHRRRAFDRAYADVMRERPLVKAVRDHALPKPTTQAALAAALQAVPLSPADRTLALTLQVRRFAMP